MSSLVKIHVCPGIDSSTYCRVSLQLFQLRDLFILHVSVIGRSKRALGIAVRILRTKSSVRFPVRFLPTRPVDVLSNHSEN